VLLVDDDPNVLRLLRRILRSSAYDLIEATSADDAGALLSRPDVRVDVLLTDVVLGGVDGCELAARARAARPALKVLFMSGYGATILETHGVTDAGDSFLGKPFDAERVRACIRDALERSRQGLR
jgi:two-component system, cell cycle sensor histidine kinase and response regulator CckA